ncbi:precorrin-3B synthase [Streptomyces sp. NPDC003717]|uniref:precorrin-3B synthase n=1 Tax=Streptomyces sp. NPDC003717 TaxID=3154276 RepID=UPI0033AFD8D2
MSTAPLPSSAQAAALPRPGGDACPGALRLHAADDGALARVRVPGGVLTVTQARALAEAARELGDGELHLTSRGNLQLRGLGEGCGAELAARLDAAGLLPSPGHERVRNVVASPLSGLDGRGLRDVRPWLTELDAVLCASEAARGLSGRFLFALDDGRGDVAASGADVTLRAFGDGEAVLFLGEARGALALAGDDAARAAVLAAETFLEVAGRAGARVWRVAELGLSEEELSGAVAGRLAAAGIAAARLTEAPAETTPGPAPGRAGDALCVHVPFGRLTGAAWWELLRLAAEGPAGELRLTPWRGVVVPAAADQDPGALARLGAAGLVTDPRSPWLRVGACAGRPGCAKSRTDVRADATRALDAAGRSPLPVYWSGCERRCGHPGGDRVDAVAEPGGGYRLTVAAEGRPPHGTALDDPDHLAAALAALNP